MYFEDRTSQTPDQGEPHGTITETGEAMTLAKWEARKNPQPGDSKMLIRFVDGEPLTTIENGLYKKVIGVDASEV